MKINKSNFPERVSSQTMSHRAGFTLIEMLVSIALVMLMMVLFAQVFQMATGAMTTQNGISNNDQKSRSVMKIIRNDIQMRTFRDVYPFALNQDTTLLDSTGVLDNRQGYIEISEGDPGDLTDDSLQITILTTIPKQIDGSKPEIPELVGRATMLKPVTALNTDYDDSDERKAKLKLNPDQPVFDDGQLDINDAGLSRAAEVCYFLRGTTLYRRVLLIRDPYDTTGITFNKSGTGAILPPGEDYSTSHVAGLGLDTSVTGTGAFWNDFDYSAYYQTDSSTKGPVFHNWTVAKDNNKTGSTSLIGATSLGIPHIRFGHSIDRGDGTPITYVGTGTTKRYIGRYTAQETAHMDFGLPGRISAIGDPYTTAVANSLTLSDKGEVTQFSGGTDRRGEDILMTNVTEFDIKVWDDGLSIPGFVNLGSGNANGHYGTKTNGSSRTSGYGNRYDTWHPDVSTGNQPPYRPDITVGADGANGKLGVDDDGNGTIDDITELGYLGTDDIIPTLKAIQITIRFIDPKSGQSRQLTIVESLVDQ